MVQSLLLNYQTKYSSNKQSQYNCFTTQLIFAQRGKTGDDNGETKYKKEKPLRNLEHITCNGCGEKVHYAGNNGCYTQKKSKIMYKHSEK